MFNERSTETLSAESRIDCHTCQLKAFVVFFEERAYASDLIAVNEAENKAAVINDLAWISGEVSIRLLNREVLGNPKLIEPNELRQVASVVCFDLHLRIAIGSLTTKVTGAGAR